MWTPSPSVAKCRHSTSGRTPSPSSGLDRRSNTDLDRRSKAGSSNTSNHGGSLFGGMGTPEMVRPRRKSSLLASPGYKGSLITRGPSRLIKEQIEAFEAKRTNQRTRRAPERTCVIDPRTSVWIGWWDLALSLALVFTAICTPIEVGFMRIPSDRWHDPLFLLNRLVDLVFVVDMAIQFILAFPSEDPRAGSTHWVTAPSAIARHYLFSRWFVVDAFSIAVSGLDIFGEDDR